jgi:hypothetical protein
MWIRSGSVARNSSVMTDILFKDAQLGGHFRTGNERLRFDMIDDDPDGTQQQLLREGWLKIERPLPPVDPGVLYVNIERCTDISLTPGSGPAGEDIILFQLNLGHPGMQLVCTMIAGQHHPLLERLRRDR